jgi:Co/Zn/Cd efflux system component
MKRETTYGKMPQMSPDQGLRRAVRLVACLNLAYFGVEFTVALAIGSVSLFADSVDFLEDTSVNFLILMALGWSARRRAKVGMALAAILLGPGLAILWTAWDKFMTPIPPEAVPLSLTGRGAFAVNLSCALARRQRAPAPELCGGSPPEPVAARAIATAARRAAGVTSFLPAAP